MFASIKKMKMKPIKEIRKLIGKNKIEIVFEELEERFDKRPHKRDLLISIKNQHNQLRYKNIKGVITYENETVGKNKIIDKILDLISNEEDIPPENNPTKKESGKLFKYIFKSVNPKTANTLFSAALAVFIGSVVIWILCILVSEVNILNQTSISSWIGKINKIISKTLLLSLASLLLIGTVKFKIFNIQFSLSLGECLLYLSSIYFLCLIKPLIFNETVIVYRFFITLLIVFALYKLAGMLSYFIRNKSYGDSLIEMGIISFFIFELYNKSEMIFYLQ